MKLSLGKTRRTKGTASAVPLRVYALDGFSRWGTLFETYKAESCLFALEFSLEDWKDVPQGLKPSSARVLWHG
jgi:hypothetical protein